MADFLLSGLKFLFPGDCYAKVFSDFDFFDARCSKLFLSRWLGFSIVAGAAIVKVPQILKIVRAGSVTGLSLLAVLLEVAFCLFTFAYSFAKGFPFSTYGESVLMVIQVSVIASLIFMYTGSYLGMLVFTVGLLSFSFYLLSGLAPLALLYYLQSVAIPLVILSKSTQIVTTFRQKSTGQLSFITASMLLAGTVARVFTTIQETGDLLMLANYLVGFVLNFTIFVQFISYWSVEKKKAKNE